MCVCACAYACVRVCMRACMCNISLLHDLFIITAVVCVILFIISIPFSLGCGLYLFQLFDQFAGTIPLLLIAIFELIAIAWVYGTRRYVNVCYMCVVWCVCLLV